MLIILTWNETRRNYPSKAGKDSRPYSLTPRFNKNYTYYCALH